MREGRYDGGGELEGPSYIPLMSQKVTDRYWQASSSCHVFQCPLYLQAINPLCHKNKGAYLILINLYGFLLDDPGDRLCKWWSGQRASVGPVIWA